MLLQETAVGLVAEFGEQREHLVLDGQYLTILVVRHHFGIYFFYLLGDQTVLRQVGAVVVLWFIEEVDWA